MIGVATTVVSVLRGTSTNLFGDTTDLAIPVTVGVPASIMETNRATTRQADDRAQTVIRYVGRVSGDVDIRPGDRLLDSDSNIYLVAAASRSSNPFLVPDLRLDLEWVQLLPAGSNIGAATLPFTIGA